MKVLIQAGKETRYFLTHGFGFPSFLYLTGYLSRGSINLLTNLEILSPHPSSTVGEDGLDPNTKRSGASHFADPSPCKREMSGAPRLGGKALCATFPRPR